MSKDETGDGCGFGIGFWIAALLILCAGSSCVKDIGRNFGRGQQEAAIEYQQRLLELQEQKLKADKLAAQMYRDDYELYTPGK